MKRFCIRLALLAVLFGVVYAGMVLTMRGLVHRYASVQTRKLEYAVDENVSPVLLMGSSRAECLLDPFVMGRELGVDVFNAGFRGQGIIFNCGLYNLIRERYKPRFILYDVHPQFDVYDDGQTNKVYISLLRPFYNGSDEIAAIVDAVDPGSIPVMKSEIYNLQTGFTDIMSSFSEVSDDVPSRKGYYPENTGNRVLPPDYVMSDVADWVPDSLKLHYLDVFLDKVRSDSVDVVFCIAPYYKVTPNLGRFVDFTKVYIADKGFELIDYSAHPDFSGRNDLFSDGIHLNTLGATLYSESLARDLKALLDSRRVFANPSNF